MLRKKRGPKIDRSRSSQMIVSYEKIFLIVLLNKNTISLTSSFLNDLSQENCSIAILL